MTSVFRGDAELRKALTVRVSNRPQNPVYVGAVTDMNSGDEREVKLFTDLGGVMTWIMVNEASIDVLLRDNGASSPCGLVGGHVNLRNVCYLPASGYGGGFFSPREPRNHNISRNFQDDFRLPDIGMDATKYFAQPDTNAKPIQFYFP